MADWGVKMRYIFSWTFFLSNCLFASPVIQILNGPYKDEILFSNKWESIINLEGAKGETRSIVIRSSTSLDGNLSWSWMDSSNCSVAPKLDMFLMEQVLINRSSYCKKSQFKVFDPLIPYENQVIPNLNLSKILFSLGTMPVNAEGSFSDSALVSRQINKASQSFWLDSNSENFVYYWVDVEIPR